MASKGIIHTLFSFEGRVGRGAFWAWFIFLFFAQLIVISWAYSSTSDMEGISQEAIADGFSRLLNLILLWPSLAVTVKRWHDVNKSGMWVFINLIPIIGWIYSFIYNGFIEGDSNDNKFGTPNE